MLSFIYSARIEVFIPGRSAYLAVYSDRMWGIRLGVDTKAKWNPADLIRGGFVERFGVLFCRNLRPTDWVRQSPDDELSVKQRAEDDRNIRKRRAEQAIWWMPGVYLDRSARSGIFRGAMAHEFAILAYIAVFWGPKMFVRWKKKGENIKGAATVLK